MRYLLQAAIIAWNLLLLWNIKTSKLFDHVTWYECQLQHTQFLPRCMECRRSLAMRIPSVRLSVKRVNCDKTEERYV